MKQSDITYEIPSQPRQLRIDSTTRCQAKCLSCHRFLSKRKGEMSMDLILELLNDISRWAKPLEEIVPVNYGEFFLRKDWLDILMLINNKLPRTEITLATNGTLLDESKIKELCKVATFKVINFSINAFFEDTYEHFMGLKGEFLDKIRKALILFKVLRPDMRLKVSMVFSPQYQTDLERDYFINHWRNLAEVWIIPNASAGRETSILHPVKTPCRSIFSDVVVGYDRKISSCCFDPTFSAFDLGYYSGDLKADWHSPELTEFRRMHNEHRREEIELCKNCTFA